MSFQVGDLVTITGTFKNTSGALTNPTTLTLTVRSPSGTETVYDSGDITSVSTGVYSLGVALDEAGRWSWKWTAGGNIQGVEAGSLIADTADLEDAPPPRFATTADLAALLAVEFTTAQETQAGMLIELATGAIIQAVDKTDDWALALTSVPTQLKLLTLTLARRMYLNPQGVRSQSEQLGSYQHTESFADASTGIDLTTQERLAARRCVYGSNTASPRIGSIIDNSHVQEQYDGDLYPDAWWVGDES